MKNGLYVAAYLVITLIVIRFVAPTLMSAQDTIYVLLGISAIAGWAVASAFIWNKVINQKEAK